ncbi:DUF7845 domain-containing protein [Halomarina oriensis]|uniref:MarR family transcriptional regulator n=1 Tax=Halomarina oriensis TaxID=671145 RepID=A0A6B0GMK2_9EURY|nr:MarR family transcriptional regulator [Halomarina oriensis]MWG36092.1 MarR family transcriptional regulator [Halomarina oriensis]
MPALIQPAPHEFAANYLITEDGLAPFFAADRRVKEGDGSQVASFVSEGERWVVKLYYQGSGIVHPGDQLPGGTDWRLGEMREFRLTIARHSDEDPVGEQDFNAHLAPRWQGMEVRRSDGRVTEYSVPPQVEEGVNVRVQGSNIEFSRYLPLLQRAADAVGIRGRYFDAPHKHSNIQDAERYVRVHWKDSGPIHARDGPIASMGHLLESDRAGYRKIVQNDDDEQGRNVPGYYHTVTLGTRRIREAFPTHQLPKEVKHYYAREAATKSEKGPLAHPKLGVSYQVSRWDETLGATQTDIEQLETELDQTLLSVLAESGLDIAPSQDDGPYVRDAYFGATLSDNGPEPVALDLTTIKSTQESVVIKYLADGLTDVQFETLETLVTDGGIVSTGDIASQNDRHVGSVRRALRDLEELVEWKYGQVSLRSDYIAELVHQAVEEARDAFRRVVDTSATAVEAAQRGLDETMSVFVAWAARHDVDVNDVLNSREARMRLRFGRADRETRRAIREGFRIWTDANLPPERYRMARVQFGDGSVSQAWRYLDPG